MYFRVLYQSLTLEPRRPVRQFVVDSSGSLTKAQPPESCRYGAQIRVGLSFPHETIGLQTHPRTNIVALVDLEEAFHADLAEIC